MDAPNLIHRCVESDGIAMPTRFMSAANLLAWAMCGWVCDHSQKCAIACLVLLKCAIACYPQC